MLARPARAADEPLPRWEGGVYGGLRIFSDDHGLGRYDVDPKGWSPKDGLALGLRLAFNLDQRFAVEGELQFTPTSTRDKATSMTVLAYRAHLLANLFRSGNLRLFGVAGLGWVSSIVSDEKVVPGDTDFMGHLGVGAKYALGDNWGLRFDARVEAPFAFAAKIVKVGSETYYGGPDFELLVGPHLTFGRAERPAAVDLDPDHDGILGDADQSTPRTSARTIPRRRTATRTRTAVPTSCPRRSSASAASSRGSTSPPARRRSCRSHFRSSTRRPPY